MTKKRKISLAFFSVLLSALVILSGFMIWQELSDRQKEKDTFESLAELVQAEPSTVPEPSEQTDIPVEPVAKEESHKRNLSEIIGRNSDCIGWICIPGTAVNYPVMHTPSNSQKYLRLSFYKEYSIAGVPFLDGRCSLDSDNLIIYGHNMKNGTMLSSIKGYTNSSYRAEHPTVEFETAQECGTYAVFAVAAVKKSDPWYSFVTASNEDSYNKQIAYIKGKALYDTGITPEYGQQLLTLSTCYGPGKDGRLLVVAVKN